MKYKNHREMLIKNSEPKFMKEFKKPIEDLGYKLKYGIAKDRGKNAGIEAIIIKNNEKMFHFEEMRKVEKIIGETFKCDTYHIKIYYTFRRSKK